ncbi:MAG TPA: hypothetical protein VJW76_01835 [Verrucomicrobiae bacterium]|nr:hypothetical protein [Verrucomicrobiae bacterium]
MNTNQLVKAIKAGVATLALLGLGLPAGVSASEKQVSTAFSMPVQVNGTVTMMDCDNSHGPQVTLDATLVLGGLNVQAIFRNNVKGTHEHVEEFVTSAVVLPEGGTITLPKQPVLGGTGGNPFIWIQFLDGDNNTLTEEIFLGRCVQGLTEVDPGFYTDVIAKANVLLDGCSNNPGPFITVDGGLTLSGLKARFIFRNNDNPVGGPHKATRTAEVVLIPSGTTIKFPKQPVLGGVGGNPWIWIQFVHPDGEPASQEILAGRCVQGSK